MALTPERKRREEGFTLIEMGVVLVVFGLLVSIFFAALLQGQSGARMNKTMESVEISQAAIEEFWSVMAQANPNRIGRYPCPADPTLPSTDPNYGREVCAAPFGGVVRTFNGARDVDGDGPDAKDNVMIGMIPIMTLIDPDNNPATADGILETDLADTNLYDGWSNRLAYAVTERLTATGTFENERGTIDVRDENDQTMFRPEGMGHFVIIAPGENQRGAYNKYGDALSVCASSYVPPAPPVPPPVTTPLNDVENCDNDAKFMSGLLNRFEGSYNDDVTAFRTAAQTDLWSIVRGYPDPDWVDDPLDPDDFPQTILQAVNTNPGKVGINKADPDEMLDVNGGLSASELHVQDFCDRTSTLCTQPAVIGGAGISCPNPGEVVRGVSNNDVVCAPLAAAPLLPNQACPAGEHVVGFRNDGTIICDAVIIP